MEAQTSDWDVAWRRCSGLVLSVIEGADFGFPGDLLLHLATISLQTEPKSKDVKRVCACYIEPFVVINGPFYRGSSKLGSALHSEGPESVTRRAALTALTLALFTQVQHFTLVQRKHGIHATKHYVEISSFGLCPLSKPTR